MQQVEDRWDDAITKRDQYQLELVLAPEFIGISATGDVTTRNQQIAQMFVKNAGPESMQQKVVSVRYVGGGRNRERHLRHHLENRQGPGTGKKDLLSRFRACSQYLALPECAAHGGG